MKTRTPQRAGGAVKMTNEVIVETQLVTESDVEQKVIYPLLSGGNYLAIDEGHIRTKEYLAPTKLGKAAEKTTGYFPDYSIWENAFPLMIVEAKRPSVAVEVGYQEATLYAQHLNQRYRTGVNPCRFVMASNGLRVLFGYWDANPIFDEEVVDLVIGGQALERLKGLCGQAILAAHAIDCLRQVRVSRATRPYILAGGPALLNSKRPLNTFAAELSPILRRYFSSSADNRNPDIYGQAYVATAEVTEYDRVLESLMKDRISSRLNPMSQEIEPTRHSEPRLTKAISDFESSRPREGQLQLITGRVGAGKSLFIRRYKELLQPEDQRATRHWAFVDFNTGPADLRTAQTWLCQTFLRSFAEENPGFDIYAADTLEQIFAIDLNRQKGIYDSLHKISPEKAALRRIDDLAAWKEDPQKLVFGLCRYFGGIKREIVAVVMDNVDRRNLNDQLDAFQLALWFMKESRAFVILQLRDETYERFKNQPPLDTFRSGIGFHISPPRFIHVVKRRLDLSLDFLVEQTEDTLSYTLPNGMRLSYPNTRVGEFLKVLYLDIFHNKKNISRVLQGLAGADVRKALDMFVAILTSGHLSEAAITSQAQGAGSIVIPEYTVLKILMRTEYRFFSDDSGFVKNIFGFEQEWENPNNFLLIEMLFFLTTHRHVRGQIGLEGYFSVDHIADIMELQGFVRGDVHAACNYLVKNTLIEADHMNVDRVTFDDSVRISAAGFIHLRILSERLEYLYGVLPVTPIFGNDVATVIANTINTENQNGTVGGYQMLNCVKKFHKYLEDQAQRIRSNFADFGGSESGTAYILRQIQSAISHFEAPTSLSGRGQRQPNLLDV
jgi:hypothetical protein